MQKLIFKNNNRFQILNILTVLVDVFSPKIFELVKLRVPPEKKKPCYAAMRVVWIWLIVRLKG